MFIYVLHTAYLCRRQLDCRAFFVCIFVDAVVAVAVRLRWVAGRLCHAKCAWNGSTKTNDKVADIARWFGWPTTMDTFAILCVYYVIYTYVAGEKSSSNHPPSQWGAFTLLHVA